MTSDEIKIKRIIAYASPTYYRSFVYIEIVPEDQTGLYGKLTHDELAERAEEFEIYKEEYAVYEDRIVSRGEYDDGAAIIDGKIVDIRGKAKLRIRYVTPYNFIICAKFNPINNGQADREIKNILNKMLSGKTSIDTLINLVERLPRYVD